MNFFYNEYSLSYPNTVKLDNDERILVKTKDHNWFLIKRKGERSWEAICVAEAKSANYKLNTTTTVTGNSRSITKELDKAHGTEMGYWINSTKQYRTAMISILATGEIDSRINVEIVSLNN